MITVSFDEEVKAKVQRFKQSHVTHPHHQQALDELDSLALCPGSTSIVQLYGPSGAGKSTLLQKFQERLIERAHTAMINDPAHIPFIRINAPAIQRGSFHFREFSKRALRAANDPCIQYKQLPPRGPIDEYSKKILRRFSSTDDLRLAVEHCFQHRSIPILIVDDAMHIAKVLEKRQLINNVDVLKDLAKETGALIILVGTPEVLPLVDLSAQNIRLSWDIEFPHYDWRETDQKNAFCQTLRALLHYMDTMISVPESLYTEYWEEFYSGSLGCVGVLKDWLTRALRLGLSKHATTLTAAHCQQTRWSPKQLAKMAEELRKGADDMAERRRVRTGATPHEQHSTGAQCRLYERQLRTSLGMDPTPDCENISTTQPPPKAVIPSRRRPGKRKPARDSVGVPTVLSPGAT